MYRKKSKGWTKHIDFMLLDLLCLQAAYFMAYRIRHGSFMSLNNQLYRNMIFVLFFAQIFITFFSDSFKNVLRRGYYQEASAALKHVCLVILIATLYLFFTQEGGQYSRFVLGVTMVLYYGSTYGVRTWWKRILAKGRTVPGSERSLVVLTTADMAESVVEGLKANIYGGMKLVGVALMREKAERGKEDRSKAGRKDGSSRFVQEADEDVWADDTEAAEAKAEAAAANVGVGDERETGIKTAVWTVSGTETIKETGRDKREQREFGGIPVVADSGSLADYVCGEWVDEVFISIPRRIPFPDRLYNELVSMGVTVHLRLLRAAKLEGQKQSVERMGDYTVLSSSINMAPTKQMMYKRILDIMGGLAGCLITAVLCVAIGPVIYIKSPGPIFFSQERVGMNGRKFKLYKFRSMYMDAEERKKELMEQNKVKDGLMFKMDHDPRIIGGEKGIGGIIRRFSLDEFPQFWNVLKGDMSLVGTRPPTVEEWEKYDLHHRVRLATKPGITGMWQVSGRSKIVDFEEVVELDKKYIMEWSIGLDLKILFKTVGVVFRSEGAM